MKNKKQIKTVESNYIINEYNVKRKKKKFNTLNLLLLQVGICLAVSVAVLAVRLILGSETVSASNVDTFINIVNI